MPASLTNWRVVVRSHVSPSPRKRGLELSQSPAGYWRELRWSAGRRAVPAGAAVVPRKARPVRCAFRRSASLRREVHGRAFVPLEQKLGCRCIARAIPLFHPPPRQRGGIVIAMEVGHSIVYTFAIRANDFAGIVY